MSLRIERISTASLSRSSYAAIVELCDAAYEESTGPYFEAIGPGDHLLGWIDQTLVSHLMWVPRWLRIADGPLLHTAYIELVATATSAQRKGYATQLLAAVPLLIQEFDIAALSPATDNLYLRLGWEYWRGPLSTRKDGQFIAGPEERVMVLSLPRTPANLDRDLPLSIEWRPGEVW